MRNWKKSYKNPDFSILWGKWKQHSSVCGSSRPGVGGGCPLWLRYMNFPACQRFYRFTLACLHFTRLFRLCLFSFLIGFIFSPPFLSPFLPLNFTLSFRLLTVRTQQQQQLPVMPCDWQEQDSSRAAPGDSRRGPGYSNSSPPYHVTGGGRTQVEAAWGL